MLEIGLLGEYGMILWRSHPEKWDRRRLETEMLGESLLNFRKTHPTRLGCESANNVEETAPFLDIPP